jgi:hypothetical protein
VEKEKSLRHRGKKEKKSKNKKLPFSHYAINIRPRRKIFLQWKKLNIK